MSNYSMRNAGFLGLQRWFESKEHRKPTGRETHLLYCGFLAGTNADQVGKDILLNDLHAAYTAVIAKADPKANRGNDQKITSNESSLKKGDRVKYSETGLRTFHQTFRIKNESRRGVVAHNPRSAEYVGIRWDGRTDVCYFSVSAISLDAPSPAPTGGEGRVRA